MTPGSVSVARVASMCGCPVPFVPRLAAHGLMPRVAADGSMRAAGVAEALRRRPWLNRLGTPVSDGETARLLGDGFDVPDDGVCMAGRRYAPLWRVLDHVWRAGTHQGAHG